MPTTTRKDKLKAYSALAGALTATAGSLDAQIVYRDISPDFVVSDTTQYRLDMDLNGTIDFSFQTLDSTITAYAIPAQLALINVYAPPAAGTAGFTYQNYPFADTLGMGDMIDVGSTWNPQYANYGAHVLGAVATSLGGFGEWLAASDKYVGVKFVNNALVYYGWVRLSVSANADTIIVKDLAYNQNAGLGIGAGLTVGLNETASPAANIHSYDGVLFVSFPQTPETARVSVYNTTGQEVLVRELNDTSNRIELGNLATGCYFVRVESNGQISTKKIYIR
ncbi:MAG: T9SS type A sorting domain-containing protein [Bacteroidetes bacterium]|nr:T9SS type A sorting domain-containing protein [Bacteroidota bacterium]